MREASISVAMCSYNAAKYVREQLDSFLRQTRLPDELVVCDDASTDEMKDIIAKFAQSAPFEVRLYCEPSNIGRITNFQKAISLCNNDIIFLSDADDVWNERKIWRMSQALQSAPDAAGVFCDAEIVDAALEPLGYSHSEVRRFTPKLQAQLAAGDAGGLLLRSRIVQGAALAFRASYRPLLLPLSSRWGHSHELPSARAKPRWCCTRGPPKKLDCVDEEAASAEAALSKGLGGSFVPTAAAGRSRRAACRAGRPIPLRKASRRNCIPAAQAEPAQTRH